MQLLPGSVREEDGRKLEEETMDSDLFVFATSEAGVITFFPLMHWLCVDKKRLNTITA